eukprot:2523542-Pleurochrysis_carterae.AAC.1
MATGHMRNASTKSECATCHRSFARRAPAFRLLLAQLRRNSSTIAAAANPVFAPTYFGCDPS